MDGNLRKIFRTKLTTGFHWQSIESPLTTVASQTAMIAAKALKAGWSSKT